MMGKNLFSPLNSLSSVRFDDLEAWAFQRSPTIRGPDICAHNATKVLISSSDLTRRCTRPAPTYAPGLATGGRSEAFILPPVRTGRPWSISSLDLDSAVCHYCRSQHHEMAQNRIK